MQWLMNASEALSGFMDLGGPVLWLIAILLFFKNQSIRNSYLLSS